MKKLNCKLIVSDFDGTLANSNNEVPQKVISAINAYVSAGGIFAVCTGRIVPCILPRIREMGLSGLLVGSQGSQIADIKSGKLLRNVTFEPEHASEICLALEERGANVQLLGADGYFSDLPADDKHLNLYESIVRLKAKHTDMPLSEYAKTSGERFCKLTSMCAPSDRKELYEYLSAKFAGICDITCSAKVLVEVSPYGETKGRALEFLAKNYGVPMEKTCAIGDNLNDLSMIKAAGVGVAVANGEQLLKEAADFVAVSNDMGAVAQVIEKFGYLHDD